MARPPKQGIDYFPVDVDLDQDDKVILVLAKYGYIAYAILVKLLADIYKKGYYILWTSRQQYLFSRRVNVDIMTVKTIVIEYINDGFFDKNLWEKFNILTSHGIQTRYFQAVDRRKGVQIYKDYLLVDIPEKPNFTIMPVIADNNEVIADIEPAITPQKKRKESIYGGGGIRARAREGDPTPEELESPGQIRRSSSGDPFSLVITAYSNNIHPITGEIEAQKLQDLFDHYGAKWLNAAIEEAVELNGRSLRYIETVLRTWETKGFRARKTREGGKAHGESRRNSAGANKQESSYGEFIEQQLEASRAVDPELEREFASELQGAGH